MLYTPNDLDEERPHVLSGIDPVLTGDLLAALDRLGHGDLLIDADAKFPAYRASAEVIEIPGLDSPRVVRAVRTVLPIDEHEGPAISLMDPAGTTSPVQAELLVAADVPADRVDSVERFAFYALAAGARLVIRTGEVRPYGNLAIRKGVVRWEDSR